MNDLYQLELSERAQAELHQLFAKVRNIAQRISSKIDWLIANADDIPHKALTGNWSGYFSLHIGHYRVIYTLDREHKLIYVEKIGHRREVYDE